MPVIKPVSELQRAAAAIVREAMETKEPIYLTKNGSAAVVLIDAQTYDDVIRACKELHEQYARTATMLGRLQADLGQSHAWDGVKDELRERWGDDVI